MSRYGLGPSTNLRKTPGRLASQGEQKWPNESPESHQKKRKKKKRSSSKKQKKENKEGRNNLDTKVDSKKELQTAKPAKLTLLDKFLKRADTEKRKPCSEGIDYFKLPISVRIRKLEEGYITDPEIEFRKGTVQRNLCEEFEKCKKLSGSILTKLNQVTDCSLFKHDSSQHTVDSQGVFDSDSERRSTDCNNSEQTEEQAELLNTTIDNSAYVSRLDERVNQGANFIATKASIKDNKQTDTHLQLNKSSAITTRTPVNAQNFETIEQRQGAKIPMLKQTPIDGSWFTFSNPPSKQSIDAQSFSINSVGLPLNSPGCIVADCNYQIGEIRDTHRIRDEQYIDDTHKLWADYIKNRSAGISTITGTVTTATSSMMQTSTVYSMPGQLMQQSALTAGAQPRQANPSIMVPSMQGYSQNYFNIAPVQQVITAATAGPMVKPAAVDKNLQPLYQMLTHISQQVKQGNEETAALRQDVLEMKNSLSFLESDIREQDEIINATVDSHNKCVDHVDLLTKTIVYQDKKLADMNVRLNRLESDKIKNNLLIWGIPETDTENTSEVFDTFAKTKLLITEDIACAKVYRRGKKGTNRPILVELVNLKDKGVIYKHTKNLKDLKNEQGYGYSVRDDLSEDAQDCDNKHRRIVSDNKRNTARNIDMSFKNRVLHMNNVPYKTQAAAPEDCRDTSNERTGPCRHTECTSSIHTNV